MKDCVVFLMNDFVTKINSEEGDSVSDGVNGQVIGGLSEYYLVNFNGVKDPILVHESKLTFSEREFHIGDYSPI